MTTHDDDDDRPIPPGQVFFDELFLLFGLSLVICMVLYNVWGLMDLLSVPALTP